jgi:hypothetical protein
MKSSLHGLRKYGHGVCPLIYSVHDLVKENLLIERVMSDVKHSGTGEA